MELLEDLLYEIFLWLPVKSLIRFRCVSKGICGMIDSSVFVKNHIVYRSFLSRRDRSVSDDDYAILLFQPWYNRLFSVNFDDDNLNRAKAIEFINCSSLTKQGMFPMGCCNGVFCFKNNAYPQNCYVLWNPSNGTTSRKVSYPDVIPPIDSMGYDYVNDDYKLVRFIDIIGTSIEVYSFRKDSWRKFNEIFPWCKFPLTIGEGVCLNGAMHWLWSSSNDPDDDSMFIASFDFVTETFRSLSLPLEARQLKLEPFYLSDFGGRLSVTFHQSGNGFGQTVWMMEKYGVERSWTKLYTFDINIPKYMSWFYFPNNKKRLLCNYASSYLSWWDPQDGIDSFERIEFPTSSFGKCKSAYVYVRNLVRLDQNEEPLLT